MSEEDFSKKARNIVYRLLNIRQYSEQELRDKLIKKNIPVEAIASTIRYFKELSLIDDTQFAKKWISFRLSRPWGLKRIRFELKEKGISGDIIERELAEASTDYPEPEIVTAVARKQLLKYKNIDPFKAKQRLYGYLLRRGFSGTAIKKVINNL